MIVGDAAGMMGGGGFKVRAVTFDGTNDYLTRGTDLTGNVNSNQGIFSCWLKFNVALDGSDCHLYDIGGDFNIIKRGSTPTNGIRIQGGGFIDLRTNDGIAESSDGWIHVLAAWKLDTGIAMYVDDVLQSNGSSYFNGTLDYTTSNHYIGARNDAASKFNGDMAQFYLNTAEYLDLSIEANRRKFISATGKPVNLGLDGSLPTGNDPIVFIDLRQGNDISFWGENYGYGGGMTISGLFTEASTSPSD